MSELGPVPPEDFDVERPKAEQPTGYRDAAEEVPERLAIARVPRVRTPSGMALVLGIGLVLLLLGGLFAMCGQHRRDLDRAKAMQAP